MTCRREQDIAGGGPQSYYARQLDKSLSGNDIRHRWVSSGVYELPVGRGRPLNISSRPLDLAFGGWSVGTIVEMRSGLAMGVTEQTNRLNAFSPSQRPDVVGDWKLPANRSRHELINQWFNTAAFAFPGNGVLGNAGRAFMTGPGSIGVDISMLEGFPPG
jgi:hypothetical protein